MRFGSEPSCSSTRVERACCWRSGGDYVTLNRQLYDLDF